MKTREMDPATLRALADELERSVTRFDVLVGAFANPGWRGYLADLYRKRATRAERAGRV